MIQDKLPEISLKVLEVPAYGVFAIFVLRTAFDWSLKLINRKAEKSCNGKNTKEATEQAVAWALHTRTTDELKACAEKTVELQGKTMIALHRLADAGENQAKAIEALGEKLPRIP